MRGLPCLACLATRTCGTKLDELAEKIESILLDIFDFHNGNSSKHRNQICYYYRTYGDDVKKCHPGFKYPKVDSAISKKHPTGSQVSVIPCSAEKCFLQPIDLILHAVNSHFPNFHTFLSSAYNITRQNLNMSESLEPNCQQSSMRVNSVKEFDTEAFRMEAREPSKEFPDLANNFNSIYGEIHNFPRKHSITSR
nr:hypothetical protein HmN_000508900 [Hymenolepis microstoma]